jgi:hypothetical protein
MHLLRQNTRPSSYFFGLRLEYWGYALFVFGVLDAYLSWNSLTRDWLAAVTRNLCYTIFVS